MNELKVVERNHTAVTVPTMLSGQSVSELLGYDLLSGKNELSLTLRELDIEPFDKESVLAYQKSEIANLASSIAKGRKSPRGKNYKFQKFAVATSGLSGTANYHDYQGDFDVGYTVLEIELSWKQTSIEDYKNEIPIHVLNKAIQIKSKLPNANFIVDDLVVISEQERVVDPFLIVELKGYREYVEVWKEPRFEGRSEI